MTPAGDMILCGTPPQFHHWRTRQKPILYSSASRDCVYSPIEREHAARTCQRKGQVAHGESPQTFLLRCAGPGAKS